MLNFQDNTSKFHDIKSKFRVRSNERISIGPKDVRAIQVRLYYVEISKQEVKISRYLSTEIKVYKWS